MREHVTDRLDCWCDPTYIDAESGAELTRAQAEWSWDGIVIVHRDIRDDRRDHDRFPARTL